MYKLCDLVKKDKRQNIY